VTHYQEVLNAFIKLKNEALGQEVVDTIIWKEEFDTMTVEEVVTALTDSGDYQNFQDWFNKFFGENGLVMAD
jgi:molybdate-binding protein